MQKPDSGDATLPQLVQSSYSDNPIVISQIVRHLDGQAQSGSTIFISLTTIVGDLQRSSHSV
jgi:hypothetical protein